jgi:hypothetical protein
VADPLAVWLFTAAVALHNAEEAYFAVAFSQQARRLRLDIRPAAIRVALAVVTAAFAAVAVAATHGAPRGFAAYLVAGLALAMIVNAFMPHLVATIVTRAYAPGTGTALLLNVPAGGYLLFRSLHDGAVEPAVFAWAGPLTALGALALTGPLLLLAAALTARSGRGR